MHFSVNLHSVVALIHSHKKWKYSLETRVVLLTFSLELEISELAVQNIHQDGQKMVTFVRNCSVKVTLRLF